MFRGLFLICLCLLDGSHAHARSHCMDGLAHFFYSHASLDEPLNPLSNSRRRKVYLGGFADYVGWYRRVYLVEETSPFAPGFVSKKLYRYVDPSPVPYRNYNREPVVPLTFESGFDLVRPLAAFADENERARRSWGHEVFDELAIAGPRYFPDSIYFWIEQKDTHEVIASARLIHSPRPIVSHGSGFGGAAEDLYGSFARTRNPYAPDYRPDAPIVIIAPPAVLPVEHILGLRLLRDSSRRSIYSEAGCYAVAKRPTMTLPACEYLDKQLQALSVHEMSLQITREVHRFSWMGYDFMHGASQTIAWADPQSFEIYTHWQGAQPFLEYMVEGTHPVDDQGRIVFANTPWRLVKWDAQDMLREHTLILDSQHVKFDSADSRHRRIVLFDPSHGLDGGLQGALDVVLQLLESEDTQVFRAALNNLTEVMDSMLAVEAGRARIVEFRETLEQQYGRILADAKGERAQMLIGYLRRLYSSTRYSAFSPATVRDLLIRELLTRTGEELNAALETLSEIAFVIHRAWPVFTGPERNSFPVVLDAVREFLWVDPDVTFDYGIDVANVTRAREAAAKSLITYRDQMTPEDLYEVLYKAIYLDNRNRALMHWVPRSTRDRNSTVAP